MSPGPLLSFGLFADAHCGPRVHGDRCCPDSLGKLERCLEAFNARQLPLAMQLGDLVHGGDAAEDREYLLRARQTCGRFQGAMHTVLGNHDVAALTKAEFLAQGAREVRGPYYSFDAGPLHFAVLDGNCHEDGSDFTAGDLEWDQAWVSPAQVAWLEDDLRRSGGRRTIVLCHENLDDRRWEGQSDPHVARNAAEVRAVLERAGSVSAVIQAHYHPGARTVVNGIPYLTLTAMVTGPGETNNAYAIAHVGEDGALTIEGVGRQESARVERTGGGWAR